MNRELDFCIRRVCLRGNVKSDMFFCIYNLDDAIVTYRLAHCTNIETLTWPVLAGNRSKQMLNCEHICILICQSKARILAGDITLMRFYVISMVYVVSADSVVCCTILHQFIFFKLPFLRENKRVIE